MIDQYEDKELREELRHVYGICDCDWKNMHCFYWSSNDPDFIDTLPQRQLDKAMQLITKKQVEELQTLPRKTKRITDGLGVTLAEVDFIDPIYVANRIAELKAQAKE